MEFSVFAQRLFAVIGAGASTHTFTRSIFEAILTDDGQAVLDGSSEESYKAYYNGNSGISRIARKVMPYIDRMEFEDYLDQFSDEASFNLCDSFADCCPGATSRDIAAKLSELFVSILKDAASSKPKRGKKEKGPSEDEPEIIEAEVVDDEEPSGAAKGPTINLIQNQTIIEHDESKTFNIENSTVTFNL